MFAALGRAAYRRRRLIVLMWSLAFVAGLIATMDLPSRLKGGGFTNPFSPSQQGQRAMQDKLGFGPSRVTIVFESDTLDARSGAFQAKVAEALSAIRPGSFSGLTAVDTAATSDDAGYISKDGRASFAVLSFDASTEEVQHQIPALREALKSTGLKTYLTGDAAVFKEIEERSAEDLRTAETYTIPIAIGVLILIFGTVVAAALPVVGGGMAVTVTLGTFWLLAHVMNLSVFAMNVATLLGLAVGIDYALFMVGRFREELTAGKPVADAVETTVEYAGRSIFFSGMTVIVGLLGLMSIPYMSMRSMGLGGALVVLFSVLAALTLLPALLGLLGPRVNALRVVGRRGKEGAFWRRWSDSVMRHPVPVLIGTIALVAVFAWPVTHIVTEIPGATALPRASEARTGYDILQTRFDAASLSPIELVLTWPGGGGALEGDRLEELVAFSDKLRKTPGVAKAVGVVSLPGATTPEAVAAFWKAVDAPAGGGGEQAGFPGLVQGLLAGQQRQQAQKLRALTTAPGAVLLRVVPDAAPTSPEAQELATRLYAAGAPAGMTLFVTGVSMSVHDFVSALYSRFPWIILFVVTVTAGVLLLLLRSVVLPVKAVVMNVFSLLAGYGAVVWIFQEGHMQGLLGFTSSGAIDAELPVIMFCTIFGVSMDYEVFLLTRIREAWLDTGDNRVSVGTGLTATGSIITSAALIIVIVAGSFALTSVVVTKAVGVGLAVAVAVDATIIRVLLVPAAMRLLGGWNWWIPGWLERILPRVE